MTGKVEATVNRSGPLSRARGDAVALVGFEDFYRDRRVDLVRTLALSVGDVHLAEEAVDVAMARAWRRWSDLDDPAPRVYRVARNWATSWWRRRRRLSRSEVPDVAVDGPAPHSHPGLQAALDELPEHHRAVIALRIVAEYSVEDTARALGIPEGTVKSRTARALQRLRTTMEVAR